MKPAPTMATRPARRGRLADPVGVLDGAQLEDAVEVAAGERERPVAAARGQQEPVVGDRLAVLHANRLALQVERLRADPGFELDVVLRVPLAGGQLEVAGLGLSPQVVLGQGRALVRRVAFRADHDQASVEAAVPDRGRRRTAGQPGADDHEGSLTRHRSPIVWPSRDLSPWVPRVARLGAVRRGHGRRDRPYTVALLGNRG
jgi:hypothetical protein